MEPRAYRGRDRTSRSAQLQDRVGEVPLGQKVLCVCAVGGRSSMATQFLVSEGRDAINLDGGMQAWESAGRPVVARLT